jgi:GntR family transcriptional regulator / MocR family aminotransferase
MDLLLTLDYDGVTPLWRQIYSQLRERIVAGQLEGNMRVPSSRALAHALGVSRTVVLAAYDQLMAEGYLHSRPQAGLYVVPGLMQFAAPQAAAQPTPAPREPAHTLIDFRPGLPALEHVPARRWGQLAHAVCRDASPRDWGYHGPEGHSAVRRSLQAYLLRVRGVRCQPEQIVMTAGAAQAFVLVAQACLAPGAVALLEDPMTAEIRALYAEVGARCVGVPVDANGLDVARLPGGLTPRLVHVTPSHQFPVGGVLPIGRRLALLDYARATGALVVEDDYDSEVRYEGAPIPALQGLDPERVIYIGTLSKMLAPALRLGYAVLPWPLVAAVRARKRVLDLHSPSILARFIDEGHLDRHLAAVKRVYRKRRDALCAALRQHAPQASIGGASTGLHLVARWPEHIFDDQLVARLAANGVQVHPVARHALDAAAHTGTLIFGYGHLAPETITEGIVRLVQALH